MVLNSCVTKHLCAPLFDHLFIVTDSCGDKQNVAKLRQNRKNNDNDKQKKTQTQEYIRTFILWSDPGQWPNWDQSKLCWGRQRQPQIHKHTNTKHTHTDTHILTLKWSKTVTKLRPICPMVGKTKSAGKSSAPGCCPGSATWRKTHLGGNNNWQSQNCSSLSWGCQF